jgi:hypothetical protein
MRYFKSYVDPWGRCGNTFAFASEDFNLFIISIAVHENVPPDVELQKSANFFTLIVSVGLAGAGDRTQATCVAGRGKAAHPSLYDSISVDHLLNT